MKRNLLLIGLITIITSGLKANLDSIPIINYGTELPFDKKFYLKIPKKANATIISVEIWKEKKKLINNWKKKKRRYCRYEKNRIWETYDIMHPRIRKENKKKKEKGLEHEKIDPEIIFENKKIILSPTIGKKKLNDVIVNKEKFFLLKMFPLNPKENYYITYNYSTGFNGEIRQAILKLKGFDPTDESEVTVSKFKSYVDAGKSVGALDNLIKKDIECSLKKEELDEALKFIILHDKQAKKSKPKPKECIPTKTDKELDESIKDYITKAEEFEAIDIDMNPFFDCYQALLKRCISCDLLTKGKYPDCCKYSMKLDELIINASIIKVVEKRMLNDGLLSIKDTSILQKVKKTDYEKRLNNLKETTNEVSKILSIIYYEENACYKTAESTLEKLNDKIEKLKKFISDQKKLQEILIEYEIDKTRVIANFEANEIDFGTKGAATLKTKGKFSVRPDFGVGFASNMLVANDASDPYNTIVPFFGVRMNFRPLDPDYPFQNIPYKSIWHRSSINISYSFTSLADDSGTRSDLYEKRSFLLGYGFRLNNAVNLTAGGVFFNRKNPDPFISGNQLAVMPYIGASVDLDIFDTFNKLFNVFSK